LSLSPVRLEKNDGDVAVSLRCESAVSFTQKKKKSLPSPLAISV
jgi:hypothetical protein